MRFRPQPNLARWTYRSGVFRFCVLFVSLWMMGWSPLAGQAPTSESSGAPATAEEKPAAASTESGSSAAASSKTAGGTEAGSPAAEKPGSALVVEPWEYSPYRVRVWIAATASAEINDAVMQSLQREIVLRGDSLVGAPWRLTVGPAPDALYSTVAYAPDLITDAEIVAAQKDVMKDDNLALVSLQSSPREVEVRVRQLDTHTRRWSRTVVHRVRQLPLLNQTVFDSILDTFLPLGRIEEGQGKTCVVRARAGGLVLSEESPCFIGKGDVLLPVFRQNDRYGDPIPNRINELPFTFLHVTSEGVMSSTLLQCNVHSAMRSPIHGRPTSRRERWALKVHPSLDSTELVVNSKPAIRGEESIPLAGLELYATAPAPEPPQPQTDEEKAAAEKRDPPRLVGTTDWRGSLDLARDKPVLQVMYIKNGGMLLARLPMVVGLDAQLVAEVPDDNPRLQAEGFVKGLNGEITDLVVQRQLFKIRVRKRITEGKIDEAQKLLEDFRNLKTLSDLQRMLDQQLTRQKPATHPGVKLRIEKMYADQRELIAKYIDVELLNQLAQEVRYARDNPPPPEEPTPEEAAAQKKAEQEKKNALPAALQRKTGG